MTKKEKDNHLKERIPCDDLVECRMGNGVVIHVPRKIFDQVLIRMRYPVREYVSYKEGAILYSMSERKFYDLVKDAKAKVQYGGKVLVSVKAVNQFLEYCKTE